MMSMPATTHCNAAAGETPNLMILAVHYTPHSGGISDRSSPPQLSHIAAAEQHSSRRNAGAGSQIVVRLLPSAIFETLARKRGGALRKFAETQFSPGLAHLAA